MRAVVLRHHGGLDALVVEDVPDPTPGAGQAVVRVRAVAVNRLDCWVRANVGHAYAARLPLIPGYDVAGEVLQTGAGVDAVAPGDRVYVHYDFSCGRCRYCLDGDESLCDQYGLMGVDHDGGYAELVVAPERNLFLLDDRVSFRAAAATGSVYLTAYHMLFAKAQVQAGDTVLVVAAGSGVGGAAAQLAAWAGARVVATAGTREKADRAVGLGADAGVVHSEAGWSEAVLRLTAGRGVNCAIDHVGSATFGEVVRSLAGGGRMVLCGASSGSRVQLDLIDLFARQIAIIGSSDGSRGELLEVLRLLADGVIEPVIDGVLALEDAPVAQRLLEERRHFGRILLDPSCPEQERRNAGAIACTEAGPRPHRK
jgi:2-desacetyl-2-hydroxyethyl bacteriochlorophyllide A dehydrogenase